MTDPYLSPRLLFVLSRGKLHVLRPEFCDKVNNLGLWGYGEGNFYMFRCKCENCGRLGFTECKKKREVNWNKYHYTFYLQITTSGGKIQVISGYNQKYGYQNSQGKWESGLWVVNRILGETKWVMEIWNRNSKGKGNTDRWASEGWGSRQYNVFAPLPDTRGKVQGEKRERKKSKLREKVKENTKKQVLLWMRGQSERTKWGKTVRGICKAPHSLHPC